MSSPSLEFQATIAELHRRLLAGDETSTSRLAELLLPHLLSRLGREFAWVRDPHLIQTAAHDALLSYFDHPDRFDATKASLPTYLRASARGDLLNSLKQRSIEETRAVRVEDCLVAPEQDINRSAEATLWANVSDPKSKSATLMSNVISDPTDRKITELMMEGVRDTAAFAELLGIADRTRDEQRRVVKQNKDRIKKAIHRSVRREDFNE